MFVPTLIALCSPYALAGVTPAAVDAELLPGSSLSVTKTVTLPDDTPKLDFVLLVDLSGSYYDDLPNIKALADDMALQIQAAIPDSRFGLATFVDFPAYPWGAGGDYAYQLDLDLTADEGAFAAAVQAMTIHNGSDYPESQYEGLYQLATGVGRDANGDGDLSDAVDVDAGLNPSFRADATRVVAITTDAAFHEGGETGWYYPYPYPGATGDETLDALADAGLKIISIRTPNVDGLYVAQMTELAESTGGSLVSTGSTSSQIAAAVLAGLETLTYTVTAAPDAECPLDFAYAPASYIGVGGGDTVVFDETITVPLDIAESDLDADGYAICSVDFLADDTIIGTQAVSVYVDLNDPPVALCRDLELVADDTCSAWGDVDDGSYDPDGDTLAYDYSVTGPQGPGTYMVELTVTDPDGESDTCVGLVAITDGTPPTVSVAGGIELWPPNHAYVPLDLADCGVTITDACGGTMDVLDVGVITGAWSDEAEDAKGGGDGATLRDLVVDGAVDVDVRAERQGGGNGRVYTLAFVVDDGAGNVSAGTCDVTVPHADNGVPAVNDGPVYVAY